MHHTKECAQLGDPNLGVKERLRAIEKAVLLMRRHIVCATASGGGGLSGQACCLCNATDAHFDTAVKQPK